MGYEYKQAEIKKTYQHMAEPAVAGLTLAASPAAPVTLHMTAEQTEQMNKELADAKKWFDHESSDAGAQNGGKQLAFFKKEDEYKQAEIKKKYQHMAEPAVAGLTLAASPAAP